MINYFRKYKILLLVAIMSTSFISCNDDYFVDGGPANGRYEGNMLSLLESKPVPFDSIAQIIKLAGMKDIFEKENFTFFAPTDWVIKNTITILNRRYLAPVGKDTVVKLDDISPLIWKKYLIRYMMPGINSLKDYPQIDFDIRSVFPGLNTFNFSGADLFNVGSVFNDQNSVKYIGYRQLAYSFVPDPSKPLENWITGAVATSDLKPDNGIVHVLAMTIENTSVVVGGGSTTVTSATSIGALPASAGANLFGLGEDFMNEVEQSK